MSESNYVGPNYCTACGAECDGATCTDLKSAPSPGDVTVCAYCGHIMVFGDNLKLRDPTADECKEIAGDERILTVQKIRKEIFKA